MKKTILFFLAHCFFLLAYSQQYWQQHVSYVIDVTLNDKEKTLDGFEKLTYTNHSPDTLTYICFHLWPNAYKNDRTAFSDQLLENGNTSFYFSSKEQKGYINRLDFKVGGITTKTEDHPHYIDVIKVILPKPLLPAQTITITTPFHVKLPFNFSRGGFDKQSFQITQWYPKPAVYDTKGWHSMPYLDQGEFYSEFGSFDVRITVPGEYIVAATGVLQNKEDDLVKVDKQQSSLSNLDLKHQSKEKGVHNQSLKKLPQKKSYTTKPNSKIKIQVNNTAPSTINATNTFSTKTLQFKQDSVHDFAWFVNKDFIVNSDTCKLSSGKIIQVSTYYTKKQQKVWKNSIQFCKDAVRFYSNEVGEYPYATLSAVQGPESFGGGM